MSGAHKLKARLDDVAKAVRSDRRTLLKAVEKGSLKSRTAPHGRYTSTLLSLHAAQLHVDSHPTVSQCQVTGAPPVDGIPIPVIVSELLERDRLRAKQTQKGRSAAAWKKQIERWRIWNPHPALGRQVSQGVGKYEEYQDKSGRGFPDWRWLLVSRGDILRIVEAEENPLCRRFPGVPGVWIAEGIFQHDGKGLCFPVAFILAHGEDYGISDKREIARCRKKLDEVRVTWPFQGGQKGAWGISVFTQDSLKEYILWKSGKATDGGRWLVPNEIWQDKDGLWYSAAWLAKIFDLESSAVYRTFCSSGIVTQYKLVPRQMPASARMRRSIGVYHEREIRPMLGLPEGATASGMAILPEAEAPQTPENRGPGRPKVSDESSPSRLKQRWCYEQYMDRNRKLSRILEAGRKCFGDAAPKAVADIIIYARRWVEFKARQGEKLPFSLRN